MELILGADLLTQRRSEGRLAHWRTTVERRRHPRTSRLFDLCSPAALPGFFRHAVAADRLATAEVIAALDPEGALRDLRAVAESRSLTPFTRGLAEGDAHAYAALGVAVADFQAIGVDPWRSQIESSVAASSASMAARMARTGVGGLLRTLHSRIHWDGSAILIDANSNVDRELEGRTLLVRPTVLAAEPLMSCDVPGYLVLHIPTSSPILAPTATQTRHRGLDILLGRSRAAALMAIAGTSGISTGQLAAATGLSDAAASRHATALRDAGLTTTRRDGLAVRHSATHLGLALAMREAPGPW